MLDFDISRRIWKLFWEGIERRSLRNHIFCEVASNMLIHRGYASGASSRLAIEYGRVVSDNPSRPHGFGLLNPDTMVPYQKNPILSAFFREIDRADELGSGMRKMMLYGKKYGGADPQMIEGDNFRMIISVPEFGANPAEKRLVLRSGAQSEQETEQVTEQVRRLLVALAGKELGTRELMASLQLSHRPTFLYDYLQPSLSDKSVEMTQPESPKSPTQKYRLTEKGRKLLETIS